VRVVGDLVAFTVVGDEHVRASVRRVSGIRDRWERWSGVTTNHTDVSQREKRDGQDNRQSGQPSIHP
jgi:hypothetical protein